MTLIQPRQAQHLQLERFLRQRILTGVYPTGSFLPSQQDLCIEFGVHAGAVRDALNSLIREHICVRLKGQGVMVRQVKHLRHFFHSLTPIEDEQRDSGNTVTLWPMRRSTRARWRMKICRSSMLPRSSGISGTASRKVL